MEEVIVTKYTVADNGHLLLNSEVILQRKDDRPKPTYRGTKIFNKTPVALRGQEVTIIRNDTRSAVFPNPNWVIKDKASKKVLAYAKEIYLSDVSFNITDAGTKIQGTIVSPTDELKALGEALGILEGKVVHVKACDRCQELAIEALPALKLTSAGAFSAKL